MRAIFSRIGCKISCDANLLYASLICAALVGRRVFICVAAAVCTLAILKRLSVATVEPTEGAATSSDMTFVRVPLPDDLFRPPRGIACAEPPDVSPLLRAMRGALAGSAASTDAIVVTLLAGGHALLEGPPGLGKTLACRSLAAACGGTFARIQCNADLMPEEITGSEVFDPRDASFQPRFGPVCANVVLADEINRASTRAQAAFLEAMEERQVTIGSCTRRLPRPFTMLATMNETEPDGVYALPRAQLDRFLFKIVMTFPDLTDELAMLETTDRAERAAGTAAIDTRFILEWQAAARRVYCAPALKERMVTLVRATRTAASKGDLEYGAGPRGSIALLHAARAQALVEGRTYVAPSDIEAVAHNVIRHRVAFPREFMLVREERERKLTALLEKLRE